MGRKWKMEWKLGLYGAYSSFRVFGGEWDLATTSNWAYNPTYNPRNWSCRPPYVSAQLEAFTESHELPSNQYYVYNPKPLYTNPLNPKLYPKPKPKP